MTKILVIDNFDSFTNNIVQYLHEITGEKPIVVDNGTPYDDLPIGDVDGIVISPGPGKPSVHADFGVCREVIERHERPILGVCLGHQGIAEVFGGTIAHAPEPAHGLVEEIVHDGQGLFSGLTNPLSVVRYHSLIVQSIPTDLEVIAHTSDGLVMALKHKTLPIWGVQFHPESIETMCGHELLRNFVNLAQAYLRAPKIVTAFQRVGGTTNGSVQITEIAWPSNLTSEFRRAYDHGARFWLDSEGSEHPDARYSVMDDGGKGVTLSYEVGTRKLTLSGPEGSEQVKGDFFDLAEELLTAMRTTTSGSPNPFSVGLVGYLGYELKALAGGSETYGSKFPDALLLWPSSFVVIDHKLRRAWRHQTTEEILNRPQHNDESLGDREATEYLPGPVPEQLLNLRDDHTTYVAKIAEAKRLIRDGESYEICLTNQATSKAPKDPLEAYERIRSISPVPYGAFMNFPEITVLSSSPETFLRIGAEGSITTSPIKGTRPRGADSPSDERLIHELSTSVKDRAENLMIVDLVRHDLNAVCTPGSVAVPSKFEIQTFRSVHQLVSTVTGIRAVDKSSLDVIRSCFPPGSMTGAPKARTMEIIDALERAPRGPYAGALGWLDASGACTLSVVIRTLILDEESAQFGIGGAITALSDPEEEFTETMVKASVPWHGLSSTLLAHHSLAQA